MLKSNKGVTLVALVITIIVLLILAGVSISLVVGDNGVLNNATSAVDETNEGTAREELEMAISSCQADFFAYYATEDNTISFADWIDPAVDATGEDTDVDAYLGRDVTYVSWESPTAGGGSDGTCEITYKGTSYTATLSLNDSETSISIDSFAESSSSTSE